LTQTNQKEQVFALRRPIRRAFHTSLGKSFVILPSAFLAALAVGLVSFGMIFFMRDVYGASVGLIGWFSAIWTISYFAGCIFLRPLFIGFLPRHAMTLATTLMGLWALCILLVRSLFLTFVFYGLLGLSLSLFFPRLMGWLSQRMHDRILNRVMARFNLSWSTATIISPGLGGYLFERNPLLPIAVPIGIFFGLTVFIGAASLFLPKIRGDRHQDDQPINGEERVDRSTPLRYPVWIGLFTTYVVMGMLFSVFPLFLRENLYLSESLVGALLLTRSLSSTIFFLLLGRSEFWHFKKRYMIAAQIVLALLLLPMLMIRSPFGFALVLPLIGLIMSYSYASSVFHGAAGTHERAKRMAIHEAVITAGNFCGASVGGTLFQSYSMNAVFLFCLILVLCGALLQTLIVLLIRKQGRVFG
jgi:predicted MFS family arabinose efflux permease